MPYKKEQKQQTFIPANVTYKYDDTLSVKFFDAETQKQIIATVNKSDAKSFLTADSALEPR